MTGLVLASTSASRRLMLESAGVAFSIAAPEVDEERLRDELYGAEIPAIASALSDAKALAVSARHPHALVLGGDQILECDGEIFTKAEDEIQARQTLLRLKGREHRLIASVTLARRGVVVWRETDIAHLWMRDFSQAFLEDYIAAEMPELLGSVGCYRIEGRGAQLFSRISGDQFSIRGLPLIAVLDALRAQGLLVS